MGLATKPWIGVRVEGWEKSPKSLDDIGARGRARDHSEILVCLKWKDRAARPNQECGDRQDSSD